MTQDPPTDQTDDVDQDSEPPVAAPAPDPGGPAVSPASDADSGRTETQAPPRREDADD